ncbi:MAG: type II toxin-antitoxin system VapC family toxin [Methanothrix sp.]
MIIIDTSILVDALRRNQAALRKISALEESGDTLCTTQINVLELYKGAYSPTSSKNGLEKVKKMLEALVVLKIDDDVYDLFGELSSELRRRGKSIGDFDELIAAISLSHEAAIVSTDSHFQSVPGLKVMLP